MIWLLRLSVARRVRGIQRTEYERETSRQLAQDWFRYQTCWPEGIVSSRSWLLFLTWCWKFHKLKHIFWNESKLPKKILFFFFFFFEEYYTEKTFSGEEEKKSPGHQAIRDGKRLLLRGGKHPTEQDTDPYFSANSLLGTSAGGGRTNHLWASTRNPSQTPPQLPQFPLCLWAWHNSKPAPIFCISPILGAVLFLLYSVPISFTSWDFFMISGPIGALPPILQYSYV